MLGKHTEIKGLQRDEYKTMILNHIQQHGK